MALESKFKSDLINDLRRLFPDCEILLNDPNYLQGISDILVLFTNGRFAVLECKKSRSATRRPNQKYYVEKFNNGESYAAFIYPENKDEILDELQRAFGSRRSARVS